MENLENKKGTSLLDIVHLALTCFIISWFNNGIVIQLLGARALVLFGVYIIWLFLSNYICASFVYTFLVKAKWLLIFSFMVLLFSATMATTWNKQSYVALYLPIIYSLGVFFSINSNTAENKSVLKFFFLECIVICVKSIYILKTDSMYSRMIAGGGEQIYSLVVSYASIYAFVTLLIFFISMRGQYNSKFKPYIYLFVITSVVTIYMANFATAIFLAAFFILLSLIAKKRAMFIFLILLCVIILIAMRPHLADFFLWLSRQNISEFLQGKAYVIYSNLSGKNIAFNTLEARMEFMENAWGVFKEAPILGIYGRNKLMAEHSLLLRDHNVWVDMLALYGCVRIIPFFIFFYQWYKDVVRNKNPKYTNSVFITVTFLFVCGFLNPINKSVIHLVLFAILPASDVLFSEKIKLKNTK